VSKAQSVDDEALLIEVLIEALLHKEAWLQLPKSMLTNYADQLSLLLRNPAHASALVEHREELRQLGQDYPVLLILLSAHDEKDQTQEMFAEIKRLCAPPRLAAPAVIAGVEDAAELGAGIAGTRAAAETATQDLTAEIMKLDRQVQNGQAAASEIDSLKAAETRNALMETLRKQNDTASQKQVQVPTAATTDIDQLKAGDAVIEFLRKQNDTSKRKLARGSWERTEDAWVLSVVIPSLAGLEECDLQIADDEIRLLGPSGDTLVHEPVPRGTCATQADPQWSQDDQMLTISVPLASAGRVCLTEID